MNLSLFSEQVERARTDTILHINDTASRIDLTGDESIPDTMLDVAFVLREAMTLHYDNVVWTMAGDIFGEDCVHNGDVQAIIDINFEQLRSHVRQVHADLLDYIVRATEQSVITEQSRSVSDNGINIQKRRQTKSTARIPDDDRATPKTAMRQGSSCWSTLICALPRRLFYCCLPCPCVQRKKHGSTKTAQI